MNERDLGKDVVSSDQGSGLWSRPGEGTGACPLVSPSALLSLALSEALSQICSICAHPTFASSPRGTQSASNIWDLPLVAIPGSCPRASQVPPEFAGRAQALREHRFSAVSPDFRTHAHRLTGTATCTVPVGYHCQNGAAPFSHESCQVVSTSQN